MRKDPCLMPSGNISIPYEYRRKGLTKDQADNYRCHNIHYEQLFNGVVTNVVTDRWFFNRMHFEICLANWNALGDSMARTPSPLDGMIYHWSYREVA